MRIPKDIHSDSINFTEYALGLFLFVFMGFFIYVGLIPMAVEFWKSSFTVKLSKNQVFGYNLWKQEKQMKFDEIVSIKKRKFRNLQGNMVITAKDGRELWIHPNINLLGECIETIRERAANLKDIDYGGWDQDEIIWKGRNKDIEGIKEWQKDYYLKDKK